MVKIQHSDIVDPNIHEPKGVASANAGEYYRADGAGSGSWTSGTGWTTYKDSQYVTGSRLSISSSTRTKVTIDGLAFQTGNGNVDTLWNTATNKIVPFNSNDLYGVRFDFRAQSGTANAYIDVEYDAGGSSGVILTRTNTLTKTSAVNSVVNGQIMFAGADFLANGLEIYVTPSANTDFFDFGILISRQHTAM